MLLTAPLSPAQDASESIAPGAEERDTTLTMVPQIQAKLAEVSADPTLDEASQTALIEQYRQALANIEIARTFNGKTAELAHTLTSAPAETRAILERLEQRRESPADVAAAIPDDLAPDDLNNRLSTVSADAAIEETRAAALDALIENSMRRPGEIRTRLAELKIASEQTENDLRQPPAPGTQADPIEARRWVLESRRSAIAAETRMLEQELLSQQAREALHRAQRDEARQSWELLRAQQQRLEDLQGQRRRAEAETAQRESEQAQRDATGKHALVQAATKENAEISASTRDLTERLEILDTQSEELETLTKRIDADFKSSQQRVEAAGISRALGQVLVERREQLPDLRSYRRAIQANEDEIAEITLRLIRYREDQRRLGDLDAYVNDLVAQDKDTDQSNEELRTQLRETLQQRLRLIDQALVVGEESVRQLGELNYSADQLIRIVESYEDFLASSLLWVRSALPVSMATLASLPAATAWLLDHRHGVETISVLLYQLQHAPLLWLALAVILMLVWKLPALLAAIRATAEPLRRIRTDSLGHTLRAIGLTLLFAAPLPLLILVLGINLSGSTQATTFTRALGVGLIAISFGLFYVRTFRSLCIRGGVAERHFRWSQATQARVRREFDWISVYLLPVALTAIVVYRDSDPDVTNSLGRLALVATMIGFSVFFARLLSPKTGVFQQLLANYPNGWLNRLRYLWFPLVVTAPLSLALLALLGYTYTAGILFESLVQQTWLALGLIVLHQVIVRWLIIIRRRLALQAAIDRATTRRVQTEAERTATPSANSPTQVEEPEPDLAALDEQTRRLLNASIFFLGVLGVWLTWSNVLPALSALEHFELWHYSALIEGSEQMVPVTAADLGLVLVIVMAAVIAAKNLPALIEILLLQTNSVSAGSRYAIKTLASYSITVVAFLTAFSTLGLNWGQVQWLVAALSVGIGFGLQEIVANFISGIIILFERPVRVGDIVTIGDTTGVVTNIQIRATTIRNWDKQELLVPNKEFITGRLLNWSLTDQQNRITIPIGIEYGSDTRKALAILSEIAEHHERVLSDPAPLISFEGFGDNALTIALRCYLDSLDGRMGVITELNQQIYDRFRAERIGMAFPQRDVHLDQRKPLDIRLLQDAPSFDEPVGPTRKREPGAELTGTVTTQS